MEAIVIVGGFVALALLALRFGRDSRPGVRSPEQILATHGVRWSDLTLDQPTSPRPTAARSYPTLAFVEQAMSAPGALTARPDAAGLEIRARALTGAYWSDLVWVTGVVPEAALRVVLSRLDPSLVDAPVRAVERPVVVAESVTPIPAAVTNDASVAAAAQVAGCGLTGSIATATA
jgi:hypothetical protein